MIQSYTDPLTGEKLYVAYSSMGEYLGESTDRDTALGLAHADSDDQSQEECQ